MRKDGKLQEMWWVEDHEGGGGGKGHPKVSLSRSAMAVPSRGIISSLSTYDIYRMMMMWMTTGRISESHVRDH